MTAISVDRLLAMLLRLRYRQIVTVKRIHVIFNYLLDCIWCQCLMRKLKLPHIILIQLYINSVLHDDHIRILLKDF